MSEMCTGYGCGMIEEIVRQNKVLFSLNENDMNFICEVAKQTIYTSEEIANVFVNDCQYDKEKLLKRYKIHENK